MYDSGYMKYPCSYQVMSATRDATQTVKQKFDVITELIEDVNQKMDLIASRIDERAPRDAAPVPVPVPRARARRFQLSKHVTAVMAAAVVSAVGLTLKGT